MSVWSGTAQTYLDNERSPRYDIALRIKPLRYENNNTVTLGYWSGLHDLTITIDGEARFYEGVGPALQPEAFREETGTTVSRHRTVVEGLGPMGRVFFRSLDVQQAAIELHHIMTSAGGLVIGTRRMARGVVDRADLEIGANGVSAEVAVEMSSEAMAGTRVLQAMKSHAHYLERGGDTSMEYASLKDAEGDRWKRT